MADDPSFLNHLSEEVPRKASRTDPHLLGRLSGEAAPRASQSDNFLEKLADSSPGGHRASIRGAAKAETDRDARQAVGAAKGLDAPSFGALAAKIKGNWNPVCGVTITIRILLRPDHGLATKPNVIASGQPGVDQATVTLATERVLAAVQQAAPFRELPPNAPLVLPPIRFNATEGCG